MQAWHALAPAATIHLSMTLCGGQCFRWRKTPRGTWVGVVRDNAYELCNPREVVLEHGAGKGGKEGVSAAMSLPFQVTSSSSRTSSSTVAGISSPAETLWFRCLNKVPTDSAAVEQQVMFLRHYLALDIDLEKMWRRWTKENPMGNHPLVRALISCGLSDLPVSIRHLRQDLHETLLTFLCSQNNNIQRITGLVERLAASYGDFLCEYNMATGDVRHIPGGGHGAGNLRKRSTRDEWTALYSLPSMAQLAKAKEEELRALGFGYRSRYLTECASIICRSGVNAVKRSVKVEDVKEAGQPPSVLHSVQPYKWYMELVNEKLTLCERRAKLLTLPGVGRKVADCILLFALDHHELVPVDTHMAQVAAEYLTAPTATSTKGIKRQQKRESATRKRGRGGEKINVSENAATNGLSPSWEAVVADWYRNSKGDDKLKLPALLPKHHDAIQNGFFSLFGDYCGWAHSILFYARMRKSAEKEVLS